jgi:Tfp pilus assembly protein PilV
MISARLRRPRQEAFTIVEVMMAAVVMLAGVVGMMQVIVSGSEMIDVSRKQTIATQIIHSELDRIRLTTYAQLSDGSTAILLADAASPENTSARYTRTAYPELWTTLTGSSFTCTRTISSVRTDLKKIVFTVTWLGNTNRVTGATNSRQYTRSGSTHFGRNGLYVTYQRSSVIGCWGLHADRAHGQLESRGHRDGGNFSGVSFCRSESNAFD